MEPKAILRSGLFRSGRTAQSGGPHGNGCGKDFIIKQVYKMAGGKSGRNGIGKEALHGRQGGAKCTRLITLWNQQFKHWAGFSS